MSDIDLSNTPTNGSALVPMTSALMEFRTLPPIEARTLTPMSGSVLAALSTIGAGSPALQAALEQAAKAGAGLQVVFPPAVTAGLRDGTLHLMKASDGMLATAVDSSGTIVRQGRVVGSAAAGGAGGAAGAVGVAALAPAAIVALPIVIAGAAAYAQHRQIEKALASLQQAVERIEQRLEDSDTGVCDAADAFLELAEDAWADGGLSGYVRLELAAQRTATEAVYAARRRWVERFKQTLEREQDAFEKNKGRVQPWVDSVAELAKDGRLEQELTLFVRALLSRTKLGVVAAAALAEDGQAASALKLIDRLERELRTEFFDLHRRLVPLARYAPEGSVLHKLPGMGKSLERAHATVGILVEHLNEHVLPLIPDPYVDREVVVELDAPAVLRLVEQAA